MAHAEDLSYIPGKVQLYVPLPLNPEDLHALYRSNEDITPDDEHELETALPSPSDVMAPSDFLAVSNERQSAEKQINEIQRRNAWVIETDNTEQTLCFAGTFGKFTMPYPSADAIGELKKYALSFGKIDPWMKAVAVDGKSGTAYRQRWQVLIDKITQCRICADEFLTESLGKQLSLNASVSPAVMKTALEEMRPIFSEKGKIGRLTRMLHKTYEPVLAAVTISGRHPASAEDCDLVLKYMELQDDRQQCGAVWDELLVPNGVPAFSGLDREAPERIAENWIPLIQKYLDWYSTEYDSLLEKLASVGIPSDALFQKNILDSELTATDKILTCMEQVIPQICDACLSIIKSAGCADSLNAQKTVLTSGKRGDSSICRNLVSAIDHDDTSAYSEAYAAFEKMYEKYALQKRRKEMLRMLEPIAPQWAEAIRTRQGIHGACTVPGDVDQAWKWKQLCGIIEEITKKPFSELQTDSLCLSREYRSVTAQYAEKSGWYHLLRRTEADISMKQALEGWRLTVKSIGKGTGKRAPMLKEKARELMTKCQKAVPGWIMPINKALESLDPRTNKFDIVIIDEASQSDVSSLAILYMGQKLIIVGDDRQVSPMAVGVEDKKISSLQEQYIKDKIPNAHLYTAKTSIYDIAKTTFQPLMLREHFRCVPEIIGFSNMLSYDGKIRPLRDAGNSVLRPAVINYRVPDGQRLGAAKTNPREAETIVALMRACFEQPEYMGKSFGVISLLGDEQVKLIQQKIEQELTPADIIGRHILCGNSANFQGDERDVIFLSLVDSGTGSGPIRMQNYGIDDAYRKRYNVAASRARDQLWVVDSLDPANDLQPGDIRKTLIEYSLDPKAVEIAHSEIEKAAESPFEVAIATALSDKGFHLVQQWKVGSYRLDIVAVCGKKKAAIECDGERWHSGEEKIREDMERQTILERLGWQFIRIRGSEYYRDPERTMSRVIDGLSALGISPEDSAAQKHEPSDCELLSRIKLRAAKILSEAQPDDSADQDTIAAALDHRRIVPDIAPKPSPLFTSNSDKQPPRKGWFSSKVSTGTAAPQNAAPYPDLSSHHEEKYRSAVQNAAPNGTTGSDAFHLVSALKSEGIPYIDKRESGGSLWIIGGKELSKFVSTCRSKGVNFTFKPDGARATKGKPGWWAR